MTGVLVIRLKNSSKFHLVGRQSRIRVYYDPLNIPLHRTALRIDESLARNDGTDFFWQVILQRSYRIEKFVFELLVEYAVLGQHNMKHDWLFWSTRQFLVLVRYFFFQPFCRIF